VSTDAEPLSTSASPHGGDRARLEAQRHEEPAAGVGREGIRGGRRALIETADLRVGARQLVRQVGRILHTYEPRPQLDTQLIPVLQFNYWTMRASHQMLLRAANKSLERNTDLGRLNDYFRSHAREEKHHDRWMKRDLEEAGYIVGECPLIAASLIGTVMYSIEFLDPCALLGWQIIGECFSMTEHQLGILELGWGKTVLRTARYHITHDPSHAAELLAVIDALEDPRRFAVVERTAMATARMFAAAMMDIAESGIQCTPVRHSGSCSNQNVLNPDGAFVGAATCGCNK
jgi:hypothetical protein